MLEPDLIDPADPVERQNAKLRKIAAALMDRVERATEETGNAFSLFQRAISLEGEVKARTRDLQRTLDELNLANQKLAAASAVADEANRAKSRFVAAASHDVRQPLNAANLFLSSLSETELDPIQRRILGQLFSALGSVEGILRSLLDISRLDSSSTRAEITSFPISNILEPLVDEFGTLARQRGLSLRRAGSSLWVQSDPYYLRQIIQNLLSNAVRYCNRGGVLVGCRRRGNELLVQVHDTGPGIADADLPVIFEEFRRLPARGDDHGRSEGVGLGLAIVRRASDLLGHRVDVRSELGRGTSFTIAVPLSEQPSNSAMAGGLPAGESDETLIVLLISRDEPMIDHMSQLLDHWGAGGMCARSLSDISRMVETLGISPDAVLIDDEMIAGEDLGPIAGLLSTARNVALLSEGSGRADALPRQLRDLPRLAKPLLPHRLRAVLFR